MRRVAPDALVLLSLLAGGPCLVPRLGVMDVRAPVLHPAVPRHEVGARSSVFRLPAVAPPTCLLVSAEHFRAVGERLHAVEVAFGLLELLLEAHGESVARGGRVIGFLELDLETLNLFLLGRQLGQERGVLVLEATHLELVLFAGFGGWSLWRRRCPASQ